MARFIPFYSDPAKKGLQRLQIGAMAILLPLALMMGVPAVKQYLAFQEATKHLALADTYCHEGRDKEALTELETCVQLYPGYYEAYELMAAVNYDRKDRREAITAYERGLKALPEHGELQYGMAQMLYLDERYPEALEHAQKAVDLMPGDQRAAHLVKKCQEPPGKAKGAS